MSNCGVITSEQLLLGLEFYSKGYGFNCHINYQKTFTVMSAHLSRVKPSCIQTMERIGTWTFFLNDFTNELGMFPHNAYTDCYSLMSK